MNLTIGSLFSGIGGFDLGLDRCGIKPVWQVETDKNCNRILEKHWPEVPRFEDVREFGKSATPIRPDIICGGFPCQDVSVAGRRKGLAGERSGLFYQFARIIDEFRPRWIFIENVVGLLSSGDRRDMGAIIGTLADIGYVGCYRVLDSQWFGVAQRRRRVFIVGHLRDGTAPLEILFQAESMSWDTPPSRDAKSEVAATLTSGVAAGSGVNAPGRRREDDVNIVLAYGGNNAQGAIDVSTAVNCKDRYDFESETFITQEGMGVRRLTPREKERLQGFSDDWTRYDIDGKEFSDSARYRMLGNAVTVNVIEWIGWRLVDAVLRELSKKK